MKWIMDEARGRRTLRQRISALDEKGISIIRGEGAWA
jgi:hypothetical protein